MGPPAHPLTRGVWESPGVGVRSYTSDSEVRGGGGGCPGLWLVRIPKHRVSSDSEVLDGSVSEVSRGEGGGEEHGVGRRSRVGVLVFRLVGMSMSMSRIAGGA